jgi:hypothetical protein
MRVVSTMDLGEDVRQQLLELVYAMPPAGLMFPLRDFAREKLSQGYPREQLLDDFEYIRAELRDSDDEPREDAVMDVMDFLYGWCSPHMRL